MNEDGHLDLVHAGPRARATRPTVFLGDGAGRWRAWAEAVFPDLPQAYGDVVVADMDADGHLDLALALHATGVAVLRGDGAGTFRAWGERALVSDFASRALVAADVDEDGRPDLVVLGEGPGHAPLRTAGAAGPADAFGLRVLRNLGDGRWAVRDPLPGHRLFGASLAPVAVGDGTQLGIVTASHVPGERRLLHLVAPRDAWASVALAVPREAWVWSVAAGDTDGDGREDILLSHVARREHGWTTGIDVLVAVGDGRFRRRPLHRQEGRPGITAVAVGHVDGERGAQVVAADATGRLLIVPATGGKALRMRAVTECRAYRVLARDLDGDGRDEIVATFAGDAGDAERPPCAGGGRIGVWRVVRGRTLPPPSATR